MIFEQTMEQEKIDLLITYLKDNLTFPENSTDKEKKYLSKNAHKFIYFKDKLYRFNPEDNYGLKKVLNKQESLEAIAQFHHHPLGGHFAFANTLFKVSTKYYWERMNQDIMEYIHECPQCQLQGQKTINEMLHPIPVSHKPFERVGLDVKHVKTSRYGSRYVVAAICYLTKYVEARALQFQNSAEICSFIYEDIICRHGSISVLTTDNGKPMITDLVKAVCRQFNIHHKTITPYNSKSAGLIERFNRVIDQTLQKLDPTQKLDWDGYLAASLFAYRSIKQETTKHSPFYLMYGYEVSTPFDNNYRNRLYDVESETIFSRAMDIRIKQQLIALEAIRKQAATNIQQSQRLQKKRVDQRLLEIKKELKPGFNIGDKVLLFRDYQSTSWSGKIQPKWDGIYAIHILLGKGTYLIKNLSNPDDQKLKRVHGNRLKIYAEPHVKWNAITKSFA